MDSGKFEALICVIEKGSLSVAAETLGYTPSGISRMMASLEEELGFPLLIRGREGVTPTAECLELMPAIRDLVRSGEQCRQLAYKIRGLEVGTVRIGTAYSAFYRWLSEAIVSFHERYPGIRPEVVSGYSSELIGQMDEHRLDLCIVSRRGDDHPWISLCTDSMMVWVPASHPLAGQKEVPVGAFAEEPYIETYPDADTDNARIFRKFGITPNTRFRTGDIYATWQMVEAGLGISMVNGIIGGDFHGAVRVLPLAPAQQVEIGIACSGQMTLAAKTFLAHLTGSIDRKQIFRNMASGD